MEDPRALIAREPMHPRQVIAIGVATALNALDGFDVLSISFASPGLAKAWGVSRAALGVVLSMELIGMGVGALVLGSMADRSGRRPTILACLCIMAVGMVLAATAGNVETLSLYRLITGLGIGGMLAATNAVVAESANARRRNLAVAVMAGGYPMGAVVGGAIASLLLASTGRWQSVFQFGAILTVAFIPLVLLFVPETIAFLMARRPAEALARINRTLTRQGRAPLDLLPPAEPKTSGVVFGQLFAPNLLGVTLLLTLAYFSHMMSFYFLVKWIPKIVTDLGYAPAMAGGVLVWTNAGGATGAVTVSLLSQKLGVRPLTIGAMICGAMAIAAFGQGGASFDMLSLAGFLGGFFTNGATAGLYAIMAQSFPAALRGGGVGFVIGVGRAGAALGPIVAGLLFSAGWPLGSVALTLACGTLVGGASLILLRYREPLVA